MASNNSTLWQFFSFLSLALINIDWQPSYYVHAQSNQHYQVTPLVSYQACNYPISIAINSQTSVAYAACGTGLLSIDNSNVTVVQTNYLCDSFPSDVSVDSTTGIIYALCADSVVSISNSTVTQLTTSYGVSLCSSAISFAVNSANGAVYAGCYNSGIVSITNSTMRIVVPSKVCSSPNHLALNSATGVVYAICYEIRGPIVISINSSTIANVTSSCRNPNAVTVDSATGFVYLACSNGIVSINNSTGTNTTIVSSSVCPSPTSVAINPATGVIYSACVNNAIVAISNSANTTIASSCVCRIPSCMSVNSATGVVYAACSSGIISIKMLGSTIFDRFSVTPSPLSAKSGAYVTLSAFILPMNATGTVQWFINNKAWSACGMTPFNNGSSVCRFNFGSGQLGNVSISAVYSGDTFFDYQTSAPSYVLFGYCLSPPLLQNGEDQTLGTCFSQPYPVASSSSCTSGCIPNYPGPLTTYTCTNGVWTGYPNCRDSFVATVPLPSSMPASTNSGALSLTLAFEPMYGDVYVTVSCTGTGTVIGSPLIFLNDSLVSQTWSYISPDTSIVSPVRCTFNVVRGNPSAISSLYRPPNDQYVAIITYCNVCLPGKQNSTNMVGLPICVDCLSGTASIMGTACLPCAPGSATNSSGQAYCSPCSAGTFQSQSGAKVCNPCTSGTVATGVGSTVCSTCAPGSAPTSDASSCVPCPPGTYSNGSQVSCSPCGIGRYSPEVSSTNCLECPLGQVSMSSGLSYCTACPPGRSNQTDPITQLSTCVECPAGRASSGGTPCETCQPGRFSDVASSYACTPCSPGSASNVTELPTTCPQCSEGTYQSGSGSTSCMQCAPDHYSNVNGSVSCQYCSSQTDVTRTQCITFYCPSNFIYDSAISGCIPCALGTAGVGVCATCPPGFYTPRPGFSCTPCSGVDGLICSGGLASVSPGYWAFLVTSVDSNGTQVQLYQTASCPIDFCPGSQLQWPVNMSSVINGESVSMFTQQCTFPRLDSPTNTMCGACEPDYLPWGNECVPCTSANGPLIFGLIILSFALVVFLLRSSGKSSASGGLAIFLFFIQSATLEIGSVAKFLSWIQVFNLGAHSVSACLAPLSPYEQTLLSILMPIILLVELGFVAAVHYGVQWWHMNQNGDSNSNVSESGKGKSENSGIEGGAAVVPLGHTKPTPTSQSVNDPPRATSPSIALKEWSNQAASKLAGSFSVHRYIAGAMSVLLFCYTEVAVACFQYLYCVDVGSQRVVFTAPTMDCHSAEYKQYLVPVALAIALFVAGFPIFVFVLLWDNKDTLFATNSLAINSTNASKTTASLPHASLVHFVERWSPLFQMFHPRGWFWQPLLLLRRSAFVLASVLLVQQPSVRFMTFSFLNFGSLLLHQNVQPFDSGILNHLETGSYVLLVSISLLLTGYLPPYPMAVQAFLFILVVPAAIAMVLFVVREQWQELVTIQQRRKTEAAASKEQEVELTIAENPIVRALSVASMNEEIPAARRREVTQIEDYVLGAASPATSQLNAESAKLNGGPLLDSSCIPSESTVAL